jgi:hypothetical protein
MSKKSVILLIHHRYKILDLILHMCLNMSGCKGNSIDIRNRKKILTQLCILKEISQNQLK